jgi:hypothetical protein
MHGSEVGGRELASRRQHGVRDFGTRRFERRQIAKPRPTAGEQRSNDPDLHRPPLLVQPAIACTRSRGRVECSGPGVLSLMARRVNRDVDLLCRLL